MITHQVYMDGEALTAEIVYKKSAFLGFRSSIKPMDFKLKNYDNIFLGVQVWGGKTTPKWDPKTNIPITAEEIRSNIQNWIEKVNLGY